MSVDAPVSRPRTSWSLIPVVGALALLGACDRAEPPIPPVEVARAYLEAARDRDVGRMDALCPSDATVFERSDEGTFGEYRDRHLVPELRGLSSVAMTLGEARLHISDDRTLAVVAWPIRRFTMSHADGSSVDATGAATFVMSPEDGSWRIVHVHFSLRTDVRPSTP